MNMRAPKQGRSKAAHRAAATGLILVLGFLSSAVDWRKAEPGWQFEFPRDHHAHRDFRTEWWYFTGNLFDSENHRLGYELTFFRQGIRPAADRDPHASRFIVDDLKFAHFATTDLAASKFRFDQKTSRGAFGEAGFDDEKRLAWIDDWNVAMNPDGSFDLSGSSEAGTMRLHLRPSKPPVAHGENGVSVKAAEGTSASHYYSIPRLETTGEIVAKGHARPLRGESWFDHEWSSSQLGKGQAGWDWISLQWEDGTEVMVYRMRLENGQPDASSSGTWIAADGTATSLRASDFQMTPTATWKSKASGGQYPIAWRVTIAGQKVEFILTAVLEDQELRLGPITYWEGAIDANGTREGKAVKGRGYLELTGYAGALGPLRR
jgi:predicted secreted hydrolase